MRMSFRSTNEIEITFLTAPDLTDFDLIEAMVDVDTAGLPVKVELISPGHTSQQQTGSRCTMPAVGDLGADHLYYHYSVSDMGCVEFFRRVPRRLPFRSHGVPIRGFVDSHHRLCAFRLQLNDMHATSLRAYLASAEDKELWS